MRWPWLCLSRSLSFWCKVVVLERKVDAAMQLVQGYRYSHRLLQSTSPMPGSKLFPEDSFSCCCCYSVMGIFGCLPFSSSVDSYRWGIQSPISPSPLSDASPSPSHRFRTPFYLRAEHKWGQWPWWGKWPWWLHSGWPRWSNLSYAIPMFWRGLCNAKDNVILEAVAGVTYLVPGY